MKQIEPVPPRERSRSLVREVLGAQFAITAIGGLIAVAGLAWTSGAVVRDNLEHWAAQWASELNELGAPFYLDDAGAAMLDVERFIAKYPEIERVSWYDTDGRTILSLGGDGATAREREQHRNHECARPRHAQPPPSACTTSTWSPSCSTRLPCALFGTISRFTSTATRRPP